MEYGRERQGIHDAPLTSAARRAHIVGRLRHAADDGTGNAMGTLKNALGLEHHETYRDIFRAIALLAERRRCGNLRAGGGINGCRRFECSSCGCVVGADDGDGGVFEAVFLACPAEGGIERVGFAFCPACGAEVLG
jgi:hypothetical protein